MATERRLKDLQLFSSP